MLQNTETAVKNGTFTESQVTDSRNRFLLFFFVLFWFEDVIRMRSAALVTVSVWVTAIASTSSLHPSPSYRFLLKKTPKTLLKKVFTCSSTRFARAISSSCNALKLPEVVHISWNSALEQNVGVFLFVCFVIVASSRGVSGLSLSGVPDKEGDGVCLHCTCI